jgi:hypothetical protein
MSSIFSNLPLDIVKNVFEYISSPLIDDIFNSKNDIYIHLGIYDKIKDNGSIIQKVVHPTIELCHLVIINNLHFAKYVPQEIILTLFRYIPPSVIAYIKPEYQSEEIILFAIRQNIKLIKKVHRDKITHRINSEIIDYMCKHSFCEKKEYNFNLDNGEIKIMTIHTIKIFSDSVWSPISWSPSNYLNYRNLVDDQFNRYYRRYYHKIIYRNSSNDTLNMKIKNKKRLIQQQHEKKQFNKIKVRG